MQKKEKEALIDELLSRSVEEILPKKDDLKKILLSGKKLRIYIGTDATGTSLHLGHATNYIVLEKFRKLGHKVILLIGDFTARIGDPTDKSAARVQLSREQVLHNTKTWINQIRPILDIDNAENPVEIVYNHDWFSKMTFEDVIGIAANFTVQQMLERDMFEKRIKEEKPIFVHEFFYPLMQGYDSVQLDVDMELCGNDQKFNALCGRTLQRKYHNKEKFVFITTLLENPVSGEKMMSKSLGTGVYLDFSPTDMYGKIMSQPDENIVQLFMDCTYVPVSKISEIKIALQEGKTNPRDSKMKLAHAITSIYHGEKQAAIAERHFIKTIQKKEIPDDIKEVKSPSNPIQATELLVHLKLASSKGEAHRLLQQKGVKIDGQIIDEKSTLQIPKDGIVLQKGKLHFIKIFP